MPGTARAKRKPAPINLLRPGARPVDPGIQVRELRREDLDQGFLDALAALTEVNLTPAQARAVFDCRHPNQFTYVAENNGRVVGTASLFVDQKFIHGGGRVGHIEDVSVAADMQRRGVGTALVRHAVASAEKLGCYKVILHCFAELAPFYRRMGFRDLNVGMRLDFPERK